MTATDASRMLTTSSGSGWNEQLALFSGEDGSSLLGVFTSPAAQPLGVSALVLSGGGLIGSTYRNRLNVRICRELASSGFHALRFDWHGVGDSTGSVERFDLDRPFVRDLLGAISWVVSQDIHRFVVVGPCFGARTALAAAQSIEHLDGLCLMSLPFRTGRPKHVQQRSSFPTLRQLRRLRPRSATAMARSIVRPHRSRARGADDANPSWISPDVVSGMDHVTSRHIPIHMIFGSEDGDYQEFQEAKAGPLSDILAREGIAIEVLPGEVHRFLRVEAQEAVLGSIRRWADATAAMVRVGLGPGTDLMDGESGPAGRSVE